MSNMSYCRFQNTLEDLNDCYETLRGSDDYFQSIDDLSSDERSAMRELIRLCKEIDEMDRNHEHVFSVTDDDSKNDS